MKSRRGRRWLAAIAAVLLALGVTEALLRATGEARYAPRIDSYGFVLLAQEPPLWGFDPAIIPWHEWDGDPWDRLPPGERLNYRINAAGLRGPLPPGRADVVFVGDSFTFGEGVVFQESFCGRTESLLRTAAPAPPTVLNAGIPGYGTLEQLMQLPALLERFRPRVVVVVFVPNDPIHILDTRQRSSDLLAVRGKRSSIRVVDLIQRALFSGHRARDAEQWYLSYFFGERSNAWAAAQVRLAQMRDLATAAGARLAVAFFPLLHRRAGSELDRIETEVRGACKEYDIPYLDLAPALEAHAVESLWLHPTDHHPNALAHEAVSASLAPFVERLLTE